jgi:acetate---CoA ligase (ADP-forming) subunit beta
MLTSQILSILDSSQTVGWVMEPDAKEILRRFGIPVPNFQVAADLAAALAFARSTGYPLAAKIVSPLVIHKSDVGGVQLKIDSDSKLTETFRRFEALPGFCGMLIEPMAAGIELIVGAKNDYQFGPVLLLGSGGTGVEIYQDVSLRMAPIKEKDVRSMVACLKAHQLLEGYRGAAPIDMASLVALMLAFSDLILVMQERFETIDLNPVMCSATGCVVADARIILKTGPGSRLLDASADQI